MNHHPTQWQRSDLGLELILPRPGSMRRGLLWIGSALLLANVLLTLIAGWVWVIAAWRFLLSNEVIALIGLLLLGLLLFDRRSNLRHRFGRSEWLRETRVGQFVVLRGRTPLADISGVRLVPMAEQVALRVDTGGQNASIEIVAGLNAHEAEVLATTLREWLAAPLADLRPERSSWQHELPLRLIELLGTRLVAVVPLALVGLGLAIVASVWNLRGEQISPTPQYDQVTAGYLERLRWRLRAPDAEERALGWTEAVAELELAVRYAPAGSASRTLWWQTNEPVMISSLAEMRIAPLASLIGLPWIELALPTELAAAATANDSAHLLAALAANDTSIETPARELLHGFDDPLALQAARSLARTSDWRVVYQSADPNQATLSVLATIEAKAARKLPPWLLLLAGMFGCLPLLVGLAALFERRWQATVLALALLVSLPWWALHADRVVAWFGVDATINKVLRRIAIAAVSADASRADYLLRPMAAPGSLEPEPSLLRWTPAASAAADLLPVLGLDQPTAGAADFESARAALVANAAARIAALDDATLIALIQRWKPDEFGRLSSLRVPYIDGLCIAFRDAQRSANTRQWINYALANPAICDVEQRRAHQSDHLRP